jgi:hypothetical protein
VYRNIEREAPVAESAQRDLVIVVETGRHLNAADPDDQATLRSFHRKCSFKNPVLVCYSKRNALYVQERDGNLHMVHEHGDCCPRRDIGSAGMSDQHKRETDYLCRAGEARWPVDSEARGTRSAARLSTGVIPDLVIRGNVHIGMEVQRSSLAARSAVERTRKALLAGVSDIWVTDTDRDRRPKWTMRVPTVGMNHQRWDQWVPPAGTVRATTGCFKIVPARCMPGFFDRCPLGKRRHCGSSHWHAAWENRVLVVDDIAILAPAGEIAPLRWYGRPDRVMIVQRDDLALYEELLGRAADPVFRPAVMPAAVISGATGPLMCDRPLRWDQVVFDFTVRPPVFRATQSTACEVPGCKDAGRLYPCGRRCDEHEPRRSS